MQDKHMKQVYEFNYWKGLIDGIMYYTPKKKSDGAYYADPDKPHGVLWAVDGFSRTALKRIVIEHSRYSAHMLKSEGEVIKEIFEKRTV